MRASVEMLDPEPATQTLGFADTSCRAVVGVAVCCKAHGCVLQDRKVNGEHQEFVCWTWISNINPGLGGA